MNRKNIVIVVLIAIIVVGVIYMATRPATVVTPEKITPATNTPTTTTDTTTPTTTDTTTPTDTNTQTTTDTTPPASTTDFTTYSNKTQTIGDSASTAYTITSIADSTHDGYHDFQFNIGNSADGNVPNVKAEYIAATSVIRLTFNSVTSDTSGIAFLKARDINKDGVLKLFHQVSGTSGVAIYEIGIAKATTFHLDTSGEAGAIITHVTLDVKYPGTVASTVDLGSTTFSQTDQTIVGGTSADGAKLSGYSYAKSGSTFSMVFNVAGSATKPIPGCVAKYNADSKLELTFANTGDIFGSSRDLSVGAAGTVHLTRSGKSSTYTFTSVTGKDFKLSGSTSPNQVILEIKL
jgi:hypothetical protein